MSHATQGTFLFLTSSLSFKIQLKAGLPLKAILQVPATSQAPPWLMHVVGKAGILGPNPSFTPSRLGGEWWGVCWLLYVCWLLMQKMELIIYLPHWD